MNILSGSASRFFHECFPLMLKHNDKNEDAPNWHPHFLDHLNARLNRSKGESYPFLLRIFS